VSGRTLVAGALAVLLVFLAALTYSWPASSGCRDTCVKTRQEPSVLLFGHDSVGGYFVLPTTIVTCARYVDHCAPDVGAEPSDGGQ
jgi:hypothetical protein